MAAQLSVESWNRPLAIDGNRVDVYKMSNGQQYKVNHHGWVLYGASDPENVDRPVPHPFVDEVMHAIIRYHGSLRR